MNKAQITAIAILLAGVAWIASGMLTGQGSNGPTASAVQSPTEATEPATSVRVQRSSAQPFQSDVVLQGRTAASRNVEMRAEVSGRVEKILIEEGQAVQAGQTLIELAINDRQARLEQAKAFLEQRRIQVEAARQLAKQSFGTQVRLAEAEAQYEQAKADVVRFELDLENTRIKAPFDGILDTRAVDLGAVVNVSDRLGTLVDLDPLKVTGQISERNVRDATLGMPGRVLLSDGTELNGEVSYVASVSDPNTRTFKIELLVPNPDSKVLAGLAAQMKLPAGRNLAHQVPPSVLTLADDGRIGIKTVESDNRVKFWPVEILDDGPEGTWVSGLPDQATIVVVGQDYVANGQTVNPVMVAGEELS